MAETKLRVHALKHLLEKAIDKVLELLTKLLPHLRGWGATIGAFVSYLTVRYPWLLLVLLPVLPVALFLLARVWWRAATMRRWEPAPVMPADALSRACWLATWVRAAGHRRAYDRWMSTVSLIMECRSTTQRRLTSNPLLS